MTDLIATGNDHGLTRSYGITPSGNFLINLLRPNGFDPTSVASWDEEIRNSSIVGGITVTPYPLR